MFNYAIFRKTLIDSVWSLVLSAVGMIGFVILFVWAMLNMGTQVLEFVSQFPFIRKIFEMGFGIKVDGEVSVNILFAVCFTHGIVLALTWTVIIAATTRVTAGEVERGTADLLLALPVARPEVFVSTTLVWVLAAAVLSACPIIGIAIATLIFETEEAVDITRFIAPAANFFCLNLAVGGLSTLVGSILNRRGLAVGAIVGTLVSSVVLNFLEPFIELIGSVKFLSLLNYFRPVDVVRHDQWPIWQMMTLIVFGVVCWTAGMAIFARKDIPTA